MFRFRSEHHADQRQRRECHAPHAGTFPAMDACRGDLPLRRLHDDCDQLQNRREDTPAVRAGGICHRPAARHGGLRAVLQRAVDGRIRIFARFCFGARAVRGRKGARGRRLPPRYLGGQGRAHSRGPRGGGDAQDFLRYPAVPEAVQRSLGQPQPRGPDFFRDGAYRRAGLHRRRTCRHQCRQRARSPVRLALHPEGRPVPGPRPFGGDVLPGGQRVHVRVRMHRHREVDRAAAAPAPDPVRYRRGARGAPGTRIPPGLVPEGILHHAHGPCPCASRRRSE